MRKVWGPAGCAEALELNICRTVVTNLARSAPCLRQGAADLEGSAHAADTWKKRGVRMSKQATWQRGPEEHRKSIKNSSES